MEVTCSRCNQTMPEDSCFCPVCGLPQLVYPAESNGEQGQPERWNEAVRDASSVAWRPAIRSAVMLGIPAGIMSNMLSPLSIFGMPMMAIAGAWVVVLYMRSQRPAWITIGAGARIGFVTGLIAAWVTFGASGIWLFMERVFLHQSGQIDVIYTAFLTTFQQKASESMSGMSGPD